uniref:Uncharacterized protein n=1 Tax=Oryza sativa subsp. japonica TaxID=39947 RepID=Q654P7_ORYSJ|nr:hypothetical protein [Oryza sativa Japonica Group]
MRSGELVAGDGRGGGTGVVERRPVAGKPLRAAGAVALAHRREQQHGRHQGGVSGVIVVHLLAPPPPWRLAGGEEVAGARRETATTGGGDGGRGEGRASPRLGVGKAREAAGGGRRGCCFDTGWLLPRHQLVASSPATKWPGRGGGRSPRRRTRQANAWMSMEDGDEEYDLLLASALPRRPLRPPPPPLRHLPPLHSQASQPPPSYFPQSLAVAPAPPAAAPASPMAASSFSSAGAAAQLLSGRSPARRPLRLPPPPASPFSSVGVATQLLHARLPATAPAPPATSRLYLLKRRRRRAVTCRSACSARRCPFFAAGRLSLLKHRRRPRLPCPVVPTATDALPSPLSLPPLPRRPLTQHRPSPPV